MFFQPNNEIKEYEKQLASVMGNILEKSTTSEGKEEFKPDVTVTLANDQYRIKVDCTNLADLVSGLKQLPSMSEGELYRQGKVDNEGNPTTIEQQMFNKIVAYLGGGEFAGKSNYNDKSCEFFIPQQKMKDFIRELKYGAGLISEADFNKDYFGKSTPSGPRR